MPPTAALPPTLLQDDEGQLMHNDATAFNSCPHAHSIVQTLMEAYEALDRLERVLSNIISTSSVACGSPVQPLNGLLDQLRAAGLVNPTDHFNGHCDACRDLQAIKYLRANVLALMRELAAQAIEASVPGAVEQVNLDIVVKSSTAAMDTFRAAPAAPR